MIQDGQWSELAHSLNHYAGVGNRRRRSVKPSNACQPLSKSGEFIHRQTDKLFVMEGLPPIEFAVNVSYTYKRIISCPYATDISAAFGFAYGDHCKGSSGEGACGPLFSAFSVEERKNIGANDHYCHLEEHGGGAGECFVVWGVRTCACMWAKPSLTRFDVLRSQDVTCEIDGLLAAHSVWETEHGPVELIVRPRCDKRPPSYLCQKEGKVDGFGTARASRYATNGCPIYSNDDGEKWLVNKDRVHFQFIENGAMSATAEWDGVPQFVETENIPFAGSVRSGWRQIDEMMMDYEIVYPSCGIPPNLASSHDVGDCTISAPQRDDHVSLVPGQFTTLISATCVPRDRTKPYCRVKVQYGTSEVERVSLIRNGKCELTLPVSSGEVSIAGQKLMLAGIEVQKAYGQSWYKVPEPSSDRGGGFFDYLQSGIFGRLLSGYAAILPLILIAAAFLFFPQAMVKPKVLIAVCVIAWLVSRSLVSASPNLLGRPLARQLLMDTPFFIVAFPQALRLFCWVPILLSVWWVMTRSEFLKLLVAFPFWVMATAFVDWLVPFPFLLDVATILVSGCIMKWTRAAASADFSLKLSPWFDRVAEIPLLSVFSPRIKYHSGEIWIGSTGLRSWVSRLAPRRMLLAPTGRRLRMNVRNMVGRMLFNEEQYNYTDLVPADRRKIWTHGITVAGRQKGDLHLLDQLLADKGPDPRRIASSLDPGESMTE
jgi:hypothetical protein